eukprot:CAMPEP_0172155304 /NCGR_PEP_ID=MMETSP1050-20130122/2548_1 /TAXON_ID=233186 /ORGANISM="Cryptomonas curvata, Strain CCAP979/52" /LENGTH=798 /DNA_ID=CAMNT_0012824181 /DNA_START=417 /DNA_END=2813 /DNA_ORIENTATION=+
MFVLDGCEYSGNIHKELLGAAEYISTRLKEVGPNILQLSRSAHVIASEVNHRLDGITAVNLTSREFYQSLVNTDVSVQQLQFYVEGCKSSISTCNLQQNPSGWNKCVNGFHSKGKGTVMSSGNTNPACKDLNGNTKTCPCCINCSMTKGFLAEARLRIPSGWGDLDKKISASEVDRYLQDASKSAENLIDPFQKIVQDSKGTIERLVADVESKNAIRKGVIFGIWAPGWVIITLAILGAILSSYSEPCFESTSLLMHPGDLGCCFHWTAFSLTVLWVSLVILPAFALLSIVGLPLADICRLAPHSGDDPADFLQIFSKGSATSSSSYLSDTFRNCVLLSNGSLVDSSLKERVDQAFDPLRVAKNRIPNQTVLDYLSAQSQSAPFDRANGWMREGNVADTEFGHSVHNCSSAIWTNCQQDFVTYQVDLQRSLEQMRQVSVIAMVQMTRYIDAARDLEGNILLMNSDVDKGITTLSNEILASVGNCSIINSKYEKLLAGLCGGYSEVPGVATGLESTWGILIVVSFLCITLFPCMCQVIKHSEQVRYGNLAIRNCNSNLNTLVPLRQEDSNHILKARLTLGGPFQKLGSNQAVCVCVEVQDAFATGLDLPLQFISVTSSGSCSLGLLLNISIHLGEFWDSKPAEQQPVDRHEAIANCENFLSRSANDPSGAFQTSEFGKLDTLKSSLMAPWNGWFPRKPFLFVVMFEVMSVPFEILESPVLIVGTVAPDTAERFMHNQAKIEIDNVILPIPMLGQSSSGLHFIDNSRPAPSAPNFNLLEPEVLIPRMYHGQGQTIQQMII